MVLGRGKIPLSSLEGEAQRSWTVGSESYKLSKELTSLDDWSVTPERTHDLTAF